MIYGFYLLMKMSIMKARRQRKPTTQPTMPNIMSAKKNPTQINGNNKGGGG